MSIIIDVSTVTNRRTGEVSERATLEDFQRVVGLNFVQTPTGFVPGGWWQGKYLSQERAAALASTRVDVDADGAWSVVGPASDDDRARILQIVQALPRDEVEAAYAAGAQKHERQREYLRKVADGSLPRPQFRSKYRSDVTYGDEVVDLSADHHVQNVLGL